MKRLIGLFVLAAAAALLFAGPVRRFGARPAPAPEARVMPRASLTLFLGKDGVEPTRSEVPKDHRVSLAIANHSGRAAKVVLAGYEGRLTIGTLEDGATWMGSFTSELPGDDFVWLVDGKPAGRLSVTGSHLTEGHR